MVDLADVGIGAELLSLRLQAAERCRAAALASGFVDENRNAWDLLGMIRTRVECLLIHRCAIPGPLPRHRRQLLQALRPAHGQRKRAALAADHRDPRPPARPDGPKTHLRPNPC